jgi:hypothetical protein
LEKKVRAGVNVAETEMPQNTSEQDCSDQYKNRGGRAESKPEKLDNNDDRQPAQLDSRVYPLPEATLLS